MFSVGEWKEKKFKGVVVPVCDIDMQCLRVIEEYYSDFQTSNIEIIDIFPDYACDLFDELDVCPEDDCPHNVGGKCHPPKYEVEIIIKYRRIGGGGG